MKKIKDEENGYVEYENPNSEIKKQIQEITIPDNKFLHCGNGMFVGQNVICTIDKKLNEDQYLCLNDKNSYFVCKQEHIDDGIQEYKQKIIYDKFDILKLIKPYIENLYTDKGLLVVVTGENRFYTRQEHGVHITIWEDNEFNLTFGTSNNSRIGLKFTDEGNILVSNKLNIEELKNNKPITKQDILNKVLEFLPKTEYLNFNNKYFSGNKCYLIDTNEKKEYGQNLIFNIEVYESNNGQNYTHGYGPKITKPKSVKPCSYKKTLSTFIHKINEIDTPGDDTKLDLSEYVFESNKTEKPIKYTKKVDENKYTRTWDLTDGFDDIDIEYLKDFIEIKDFNNNNFKKLCNNLTQKNADKLLTIVEYYLRDSDLPSFSFDKGEPQPEHYDFKGLVKLPNNIYMSFEVEDGDAEEISWSHSIYNTDIVNLMIL